MKADDKKPAAKDPQAYEAERLLPLRKTMLFQLAVSPDIGVSGNTFWEELTCVGYNPQTNLLEAVVSIKRSTGYSGGLCTTGSKEYVRFFVDYGGGFQDLGFTSFDAHDIPDPGGTLHPIEYMVRMPLPDAGQRRCCRHGVIPTVRAVLSWNTPPPTNPNLLGPFGNRLDARIQLAPKPYSLACLLEDIKIDLPVLKMLDLEQALPKKSTPLASTKFEKFRKYRQAKIPDHRALAPVVHAFSGQQAPQGAQISPAQFAELAKLNVNWQAILDALSQSSADVSFEELTCVGLETAADTLGAVIHVKQPTGYSGDLCEDGSKEYVAFWADWKENVINYTR
ncbi:MAG TPA: hypothetical protein VFL57_20305 [Bryobacteraceae bacterium]|nr:hypothetical protein [Bryobacteraceae bacterium]